MLNRWLVLFLFCLFSTVLQAETNDYSLCGILNIRIKNDSPNDCIIKKYYLPFGRFAKKSQMPEVIFRSREATFSLSKSFDGMVSEGDSSYLRTSMFIFLQCGEDAEIALFINTPFLSRSSVQEQKNMRAEGTYQICNNIKGTARPWEITWVLQPPKEEAQP